LVPDRGGQSSSWGKATDGVRDSRLGDKGGGTRNSRTTYQKLSKKRGKKNDVFPKGFRHSWKGILWGRV